MASMAYIWREGFLVGLIGGHGRAYFSGVGRYSLVKSYVRSFIIYSKYFAASDWLKSPG